MRKIREVLQHLFGKNHSLRATATYVGVSRTAVSDYKTRFVASRLTWPLSEDLDDEALEQALYPILISPPHKPTAPIDFHAIHLELHKKGSTLSVLHSEWCETILVSQQISYSQFSRRYRQFKKSLPISMRQVYVDAEFCFVDYAGQTVSIQDPKTGEERKAQIFIGVLGGSNYTFCEATWTQKLQDWIESHCRMFEFFDGVPRIVVLDNLKSGVTKAHRYDPVVNESYYAMCRYYDVHPLPARAREPRDKAKAEAGVLLAERWILFRLRKRKFFSLHDLNHEIRLLLDQLNFKPFQKMPGSRFGNWLASEKGALQPLPRARYEFAEWGKARAGLDYLVNIEGHFYSVPYQYRGQEFEHRLTATKVDFYLKNKFITSHTRSNEVGKSSIHAEHRPKEHTVIANWSRDESLEWAREVGPSAEKHLSAQIGDRINHLIGYRATQSMKLLARTFGNVRLEEASTFALKHKLSGAAALRKVLAGNLDLVLKDEHEQIEGEGSAEPLPPHENIRGPEHYGQILTNPEETKP